MVHDTLNNTIYSGNYFTLHRFWSSPWQTERFASRILDTVAAAVIFLLLVNLRLIISILRSNAECLHSNNYTLIQRQEIVVMLLNKTGSGSYAFKLNDFRSRSEIVCHYFHWLYKNKTVCISKTNKWSINIRTNYSTGNQKKKRDELTIKRGKWVNLRWGLWHQITEDRENPGCKKKKMIT